MWSLLRIVTFQLTRKTSAYVLKLLKLFKVGRCICLVIVLYLLVSGLPMLTGFFFTMSIIQRPHDHFCDESFAKCVKRVGEDKDGSLLHVYHDVRYCVGHLKHLLTNSKVLLL